MEEDDIASDVFQYCFWCALCMVKLILTIELNRIDDAKLNIVPFALSSRDSIKPS